MNYQKCASEIIKNIGGKDNISHLEHCSTRLRFTLYDNSKINIESLEKNRWCIRSQTKCANTNHHWK